MKLNLLIKILLLIVVITVLGVISYGVGWKRADDERVKEIDSLQSQLFTARKKNKAIIRTKDVLEEKVTKLQNQIANKQEIDIEDKSNSVVVGENDIKIDTSDWLTYQNEEYGFELKYPKTWIKKIDGNPKRNIHGFTFQDTNSEQNPKLSITLNPAGIGYEYLVNIAERRVLLDDMILDKTYFFSESDPAMGCGKKGVKGFRSYLIDPELDGTIWNYAAIQGIFCLGDTDYTLLIDAVLSTFKFL